MFNIITDSTAYFSREQAKELNITIIPMTFIVNGKKYAEGYFGEQKYHIKEIENYFETCKTSQPNLKVLTDAFLSAAKNGRDVLYISISSRLSGAYNSALLAAAEVKKILPEHKNKILILDSMSVAAGENLLTKAAVNLKNNGEDIENVYKKLLDMRENVKVLFSVSDVSALRRSGRIGVVKQSISNILNTVPLLMLKDGAIESILNARGIYNFLKKVKEYIPQNIQEVTLMAFEEEKLNLMQNYLNKNYPTLKRVNKMTPGAVLAIHLGYKSFGIVWCE